MRDVYQVQLSATVFVSEAMLGFQANADFSAWHEGGTIFALLTVLVLDAHSVRFAVACRPLLRAGFLED